MSNTRAQVVTRISAGFVLDQVRVGRRGLDFVDALVMLAVTQANVEPVMRDPALQRAYATYESPPPDELRRPISINAIAQSLALPYETVRRRIARLAKFGAYRFTPSGVYVPTGMVRLPTHRAGLEAAYERIRALYFRLMAIDALGAMPAGPAEAWDGPAPLRAAARISTEYLLRLIDLLIGELGDPFSAAVWMEILRSNTEHVGDDEADEIVPRPVRVATIARRLGLPAETIRRRVTQLGALGACEWTRGGLIVTEEILARPGFVRFAESNEAQLRRMFSALAQLGVTAAWSKQRAAEMKQIC